MSEVQETIDIVEQRGRLLIELKKQIDIAYKQRNVETYIPEEKNTAEAIAKAREKRTNLEGTSPKKRAGTKNIEGNFVTSSTQDEEVFIDTGEFVPLPNAVYVTNSHDYPELVRMSLEKLADERYYDRKDIGKTTRDILEHEYEHHVPALGQDGLTVRYLIEFLEDKNRGIVGIRPAINLSGRFTVKLYQEIVNAAQTPSAIDKVRG